MSISDLQTLTKYRYHYNEYMDVIIYKENEEIRWKCFVINKIGYTSNIYISTRRSQDIDKIISYYKEDKDDILMLLETIFRPKKLGRLSSRCKFHITNISYRSSIDWISPFIILNNTLPGNYQRKISIHSHHRRSYYYGTLPNFKILKNIIHILSTLKVEVQIDEKKLIKDNRLSTYPYRKIEVVETDDLLLRLEKEDGDVDTKKMNIFNHIHSQTNYIFKKFIRKGNIKEYVDKINKYRMGTDTLRYVESEFMKSPLDLFDNYHFISMSRCIRIPKGYKLIYSSLNRNNDSLFYESRFDFWWTIHLRDFNSTLKDMARKELEWCFIRN